MIQVIERDITTVDNGLIVQGVNCMNAMGSGVALAILKKWPKVKREYHSFCNTANIRNIPLLGKVNFVSIENGLVVANAFTQQYYGKDGKKYASVEAIDLCFSECVFFAKAMGFDIYMPKIASDLGGLDWDSEVLPIIQKYDDINEGQLNIFVCVLPSK